MTLPADYQAALHRIYNHVDYERRRSVPYDQEAWDLNRMRLVLAALDDPHEGLSVVHVAGSKGKGSTAAMIESVLRISGQSTGLYTSPHLHTFRERMRVDGELIGRSELVRLLDQALPAIEAVPGITTFEIITALALLFFAQQGVDWVVLEVGLGGRLDATNVVWPALSVITPISFEHTALLGNTLGQIAGEKAGIVKPMVPVICAPQPSEAGQVIADVCGAQQARLVQIGREWTWRTVADSLEGQIFDVAYHPPVTQELGSNDERFPQAISHLQIPLLGAHQLSNATTAVAASSELVEQGVPITLQALRAGLATVYWPGRLEVLQHPTRDCPSLVIDSAHNVASLKLLRVSLAHYFPGMAQRWVVGVSEDKDAEAILRLLLPAASSLIVTRSRHPRAIPAAVLGALAKQIGFREVVETVAVSEALAAAMAGAGPEHVVCGAGSLFVAAEMREAWLARKPSSLAQDDWARLAESPDPGWQVVQAWPQAVSVSSHDLGDGSQVHPHRVPG